MYGLRWLLLGFGLAVVAGVYLYTRYQRNQIEDSPQQDLFDSRVDPWENVNLISREPEVAAAMRKRLDDYLAGEPADDVRATNVRIDPNIAQRLRAMGYLD